MVLPVVSVPASTRTVPDAPTVVASDANEPNNRPYDNGRANVDFTNPSWDGKLPITSYTAQTVTGTPSGTNTGATVNRDIIGLNTTSGGSYTFNGYVTNAVGNSANSATTGTVIITSVPATMSAPTVSTPAYNIVTVSFTAPNDGGKTITDYSIVSSPSVALTQSGTGSSRTVTGNFTAGTAYTFTIAAINANGTGQASAASAAITPNNVTSSGGQPAPFTQGSYRYHVFTSGGTLTVTGTSRTLVEALIVGGGGGGNGSTSGGGGGGGASDSITVAATTLTTGTYTIAVGNGGLSASAGGTSSFNGSSRAGGGAGGTYFSAGGNGSCGGGGGQTAGGTVAGGTGSQGGNGGTGTTGSAGSGGGAGIAAGTIGSTGSTYSTWYTAAGTAVGTIGVGGGISGGTAGAANTGNGGNGRSGTAGGGAGGTGMVIVRYPA